MIFHLAKRELYTLFLSPLAWAVLAIVQLILSYLFLVSLADFMQIQPQLQAMESAPGATEQVVVPLYASSAFIMMMVVPLLSMRIISDERRNRSIALLFSAPLSITEIVLGKYFGLAGFVLIMTLMTTLMPLSLFFYGGLDAGLFLSVVLGMVLLLSAFAAIGLYMSTLTTEPVVAAMSSFGVLLLLWIIDWAGGKAGDAAATGLLSYLSMLQHFIPFAQGVFNSSDFVYYLLVISLFIGLSIRRLDADRLPH